MTWLAAVLVWLTWMWFWLAETRGRSRLQTDTNKLWLQFVMCEGSFNPNKINREAASDQSSRNWICTKLCFSTLQVNTTLKSPAQAGQEQNTNVDTLWIHSVTEFYSLFPAVSTWASYGFCCKKYGENLSPKRWVKLGNRSSQPHGCKILETGSSCSPGWPTLST